MPTRSLPSRVLDGLTDFASNVLTRVDDRRSRLPGPVVPEVRVDPSRVPYFRREIFPAAGPVPWLDRPDALDQIDRAVESGRLSGQAATLARAWVRDGFIVLPKFFSRERTAAAWAAYEGAIADGIFTPLPEAISADDVLPGRILDPHLKLPAFNALLRDPDMLEVVGMLSGARPLPFQTIVGHKGSEQSPHSDSIHMTTYPMGYLIANWIALEDIHPDSGPLVYFPGSHRLPYLTAVDLDIPVSAGGPTDYATYHTKYEPAIAKAIALNGLQPAYFTPQAGDVLLWHANLIHGGSARRAVERSRKALVCHYFAEGCVTYHDLTAIATRVEVAKLARRRDPRFVAIDLAVRALEGAFTLAARLPLVRDDTAIGP